MFFESWRTNHASPTKKPTIKHQEPSETISETDINYHLTILINHHEPLVFASWTIVTTMIQHTQSLTNQPTQRSTKPAPSNNEHGNLHILQGHRSDLWQCNVGHRKWPSLRIHLHGTVDFPALMTRWSSTPASTIINQHHESFSIMV